MWFGIDHQANTIVWGLPGNPISALVCLHRYLLNRNTDSGHLSEVITFKPNLTLFVPVKMSANRVFTPIMPNNSGDFIALTDSDGFVELPPAQTILSPEQSIQFYPWY